MSVRPSMFGRGASLRPSTISAGSSRMNGEIDLRDEFDKLIYGLDGDGEGRHSYPVILRRMRRDSDGYPMRCTCAQGSPNYQGNPDCQYCLGEGYLWDEEWALTYSMFVGPDGGMANRYVRMPPGGIRVNYILFYFRYDTGIRHNDKIVTVRLDEEGEVELSSVTNSFIRESIYKPETIAKYRSDNGRIEYFGVYCREEDAIRNENPV